MQHSLIYFPDYTHANPYQALLYRHVDGDFHVRRGTIADAQDDLRRAAPGTQTIFHLHWEDAVYRHLPSADQAFAESQAFLDRLEQFVDDGGLFLWTLHNLAPHDGRYPAAHRALCDKLVKLADQLHVHSFAAVPELERDRRLDRRKVVVVPHGNYRPVYQRVPLPTTERGTAVGETARRFLLFGRLGRYKGGELLVRAFAALGDIPAELVIAGKQIDPIDLNDLPRSVAGRITLDDRFLGEDEVARLIAGTDFMVSPYLASLTSGTVLLAMSLGQPVIAPRFPTLQDLVVDGENGLLFEPGSETSLTDALRRACQLHAGALHRLRQKAQATAERYDWQIIGNQFSGLLHRLVARTRPRRPLPVRAAAMV
jgi:beta-1,4-mannosyltransferase